MAAYTVAFRNFAGVRRQKNLELKFSVINFKNSYVFCLQLI